MLAGSYKVHERLCSRLGLDAHLHGPQTTPDGKFTVEFVECLASCGTAPVVLIDDDLHEKVDIAKAQQLSNEIKQAAAKRS